MIRLRFPKLFLFLTISLNLLFWPLELLAEAPPSQISYELALSFDLQEKLLSGTAHLTIPAGEDITLFTDTLTITAALLQKGISSPGDLSIPDQSRIFVAQDTVQQDLYISYTKKIVGQRDNFITEKGITLLDSWYPRPAKAVRSTLSAILPQGFIAFSESDHFPTTRGKTSTFSFSEPTDSLHFAAAPFVVDSMQVRDNLMVYTYFFKQDRDLAADYLRAAKSYILRYEQLIGKYPYAHFAIVENRRPTGYGMPTFTLLGSSIIRLPFIKKSSLGHEILHSWFGNAVMTDATGGNWSEGLTSYLADWLYKEESGEGAANRKENIFKFHSYVNTDNAIALQSFISPSHHQPMAKAVRSTGYIKGAMLFHELRKLIGDQSFFKGLQQFYSSFNGRLASWHDIERVFETVSGTSLDTFFQQRLTRQYVIDFSIDDITTTIDPEINLSFTVQQNSAAPFEFMLPFKVKTLGGYEHFMSKISSTHENIRISLHAPPSQLIIDPEYDLLRQPGEEERFVPWSFFLGSAEATIVIPDEEKEHYTAFLNFCSEHNWPIEDSDEIRFSDVMSKNLVLVGRDNSVSKTLFGSVHHPAEGVTLETRPHPLDRSKAVLLLSASTPAELEKSMRKLSHYGRYTYLHFRNGKNVEKRISIGSMGLHFSLAPEPLSMAAKNISDLQESIDAAAQSQIIYIGERHTSMTDHILQRLFIEGIYRSTADIAIGLEMFPKSSQDALDQYILADKEMSEQDFLKDSKYFDVWKFDYRYYKNIIDFAKKQKIPVLGLNVDSDIVTSIFKNGSTAMLTDQEKSSLPAERDLSLPGYYERLKEVHDSHMQGGHGEGGLTGFIQAQAMWDEAMAENIFQYLTNNPGKKFIVLAGSQHTRKDNGIPPRVQRRGDFSQSVITSYDGYSLPNPTLADYYIFSREQFLSPAGKIGISIEEKNEKGDTFLEITGLSENGNASAAGLKTGDRLVSYNGFTISSMEDLRIAMVNAKPGDMATIVVERTSNQQRKQQIITVELFQPPHSQ